MMMMNKIIIKLYVPSIEEKFDLKIPLNKKVSEIILLLIKAVDEISGGSFKPEQMPCLYTLLTEERIDVNLKVRDTKIRNGTELILI